MCDWLIDYCDPDVIAGMYAQAVQALADAQAREWAAWVKDVAGTAMDEDY